LALEESRGAVALYPNPAEDKLYITHSSATAVLSVKLISSQGKEVKKASGIGEIVLDVSNMGTGVFIAIINNSPYKIIRVK
jgi:thymidine phosphorylase